MLFIYQDQHAKRLILDLSFVFLICCFFPLATPPQPPFQNSYFSNARELLIADHTILMDIISEWKEKQGPISAVMIYFWSCDFDFTIPRVWDKRSLTQFFIRLHLYLLFFSLFFCILFIFSARFHCFQMEPYHRADGSGGFVLPKYVEVKWGGKKASNNIVSQWCRKYFTERKAPVVVMGLEGKEHWWLRFYVGNKRARDRCMRYLFHCAWHVKKKKFNN